MTEQPGQEDSFVAAKVQQKRDSIMNELYNDISSSDDDDDEDNTTAAPAKTESKTVSSGSPAKAASNDAT